MVWVEGHGWADGLQPAPERAKPMGVASKYISYPGVDSDAIAPASTTRRHNVVIRPAFFCSLGRIAP